MSEPQKSKSELKHVIDLYLSKASPEPVSSSSAPKKNNSKSQVVSFLVPFDEQLSFILNSAVASHLSQYAESCYLATNFPSENERVLLESSSLFSKRDYFSLAENKSSVTISPNFYWVSCSNQKNISEPNSLDSEENSSDLVSNSLIVTDLFKNFNLGCETMVRVLDHVVLMIKPEVEDLKNAYKIIKACQYINRDLDVSLIFNTSISNQLVENIFSHFSDIVSQHLAYPIRCLGNFHLDIAGGKFPEKELKQINWDSIVYPKIPKTDSGSVGSLEQIRFLRNLKNVLGDN